MASLSTRLSVLLTGCALLAVHRASAQSSASTQSPPPQRIESGFGQGAYRPEPGITAPVALVQPPPRYTADARRTNIEGEVELEAIVLTDGTVGPVRVVKSLDSTFGLDDEAVRTARQWRFRPALYNDKPVPMVVRLLLEFRLSRSQTPIRPAAPLPRPSPAPPYWIDDAEFLKGVALVGQRGVTMPVPERTVEPKYTSEAMRAKVTGTVTVDMVVGPDGSVVRSRIARSLDTTYGLDRTALDAASQWRFKPGLVNGQPAHVLVTVTMEFRLH
jgi:TonB family protein